MSKVRLYTTHLSGTLAAGDNDSGSRFNITNLNRPFCLRSVMIGTYVSEGGLNNKMVPEEQNTFVYWRISLGADLGATGSGKLADSLNWSVLPPFSPSPVGGGSLVFMKSGQWFWDPGSTFFQNNLYGNLSYFNRDVVNAYFLRIIIAIEIEEF